MSPARKQTSSAKTGKGGSRRVATRRTASYRRLLTAGDVALGLGIVATRPAVRATTQAVRQVSNIEALGRILYTDYIYLFQAAGMILLLAMIGAIVLTLRHKPHVKRQSISAQVNRRVEDSMEVVKVKPGQGI